MFSILCFKKKHMTRRLILHFSNRKLLNLTCNNHTVSYVSGKFTPLSHSAGNNRGGRSSKDKMEEKQGEVRIIHVMGSPVHIATKLVSSIEPS